MANRFDPSSMPESTSPTVRLLRTFVEDTIFEEVERVSDLYGKDIADVVQTSLKKVTTVIFHRNPAIHMRAKEDPTVFDEAIRSLFAITDVNNG